MFVENVRFTPGTTTITVSDKNDIDSYAIDGVKFATAKDLLVTSGGKITPKSGALRWELATVLQLFCENVLGWEAQFGVERMCEDTWRWQKNNPNGYNK